MRLNTLLVLLLLVFGYAHAEVYRWEYNGQVTYSDKKPHPNAKRIKLQDLSTYKQRRLPNVPALTYDPNANNPKKDPAKTYAVTIVSPANNQAINVTSGEITIQFEVSPALVSHAGHRIYYQVGNVSGDTDEMEVLAKNLNRGTHTITAVVKDNQGTVLSRTSRSTVTVLRPSILFKKSGKMAPQAPAAPKAK